MANKKNEEVVETPKAAAKKAAPKKAAAKKAAPKKAAAKKAAPKKAAAKKAAPKKAAPKKAAPKKAAAKKAAPKKAAPKKAAPKKAAAEKEEVVAEAAAPSVAVADEATPPPAPKAKPKKKKAAAVPATSEMQATSRRLRRQLTGIVVSTSGDKTAVVKVTRTFLEPSVRKYVRRSKKYMAHDEGNVCERGDHVTIEECRPVSKRKRWRLRTVNRKNASA